VSGAKFGISLIVAGVGAWCAGLWLVSRSDRAIEREIEQEQAAAAAAGALDGTEVVRTASPDPSGAPAADEQSLDKSSTQVTAESEGE